MLINTTRAIFALVALAQATVAQETGEHTDWPRWCGKVYKSGYPSFNPGGQTIEPPRSPEAPLLYMQFKPRYSLYLESESQGSFIVHAASSPYHGKPIRAGFARPARLDFTITLVSNGAVLVNSSVIVNTTRNIFPFSLKGIKPSLEPQNLILSAAYMGGDQVFDATSELLYLPEKTEGSVTKVDNLNGGLLFRNAASEGTFQSFLPYGYYAGYDGFLGANDSTDKIKAYAEYGLNAMTPLTQFPQSAHVFEYMDDINLKYMYNLREGYKNLTWVEQNVMAARTHDALFAYWSVDEADGWQDPFNASRFAYEKIRQLDPYHPVAVVLNCQNYYFREYTEHSSDIIMEDTYPIGVNSTFSKWGTECNTTLGDCGCDNCVSGPHAIRDVSDRLDVLATYERWEGLWPKMKAHNPQSFHGEDYWMRDPTPEEEYAMCIVAFNHGAQAIISWVYPAAEVLNQAHGKLAAVVTAPPVVDFLVGADQPHAIAMSVSPYLDVAYWVRGGRVLVSIVNAGYNNITGVEINLSQLAPIGIDGMPWGDVQWQLQNFRLTTAGLAPLQTSMITLKLQAASTLMLNEPNFQQ